MEDQALINFAYRMLKRDWRAGELRIIFISLVIAVASMSSVNFFVDRIDKSLRQHANELLAADLVIQSDHPISQKFSGLAAGQQLQTANAYTFRSMVLAGDKSHLAEIKAVDNSYPLRGQLRITDRLFGPETATTETPGAGTVWLDSELMMRLNINIGDEISLGKKTFLVASILAYEPDRGSGMFNIAPRLLLNMADLAATQLIQEGSRISYHMLLAGTDAAITKFRKQSNAIIERGERIVEVTDARQEVREALNRAQRFLGLAALVSVVLAAVAMAMAIRSFVQRHLDSCAIMRCVGASQRFVFNVYLLEMVLLGLIASFLGCMIGYFGHIALIAVLGQLLVVDLPAPSWFPFLFGMSSGIALLLVFVVPPLLQLKDVPTMRVIRRELGDMKATTLSAISLGAVVIAGLLIWQAGDTRLGLYLFGGLLVTIIVLALVSLVLLIVLRRLRNNVGVAWRFGIANISRRAKSSVTQIVAFGIGMMALLLLSFVTNDLLKSWKERLPADTPNRFVINIQADQVEGIRQFFTEQAVEVPEFFPMVRARLTKINDRAVTPGDYDDARAKRLVEREFNLSWAEQLKSDNKIIDGEWWTNEDKTKKLISMEEDISRTLDIKLGDSLTFLLSGEVFNVRVASIRQVAWDSFRVNFFALASPGLLEHYPASYITSFYLPPDEQIVLTRLVQQFPNLTVVDISSIMNKIRDIILRVTDAVQYVFLFTLLAGLVVLYAAILSTHDERVIESAMLRTFGASKQQLVKGLMSEFIILGVMAGIVAAFTSTALAYVLAENVLEMPYHFNLWLWLVGPLGGGAGVGLAGYLGVRSILKQSPLQILRSVSA